MEEWRIISGFEDYAVSNAGRVKRVRAGASNAAKPGKILRPSFGGKAKCYERVTLYRHGKPTYHSVHTLVLTAFVGRQPTPEHEAAHRDGKPWNNTPCNLRWALPVENAADRSVHGTQVRGSDHPNSKFTHGQVAAARAEFAAGRQIKDLAKNFGVGTSTMGRLVHGETYR